MEAQASQTTLADGLTPTILGRRGPSFSSHKGSSPPSRPVGAWVILSCPNRMTAATHSHVSQGYLRPRGRRDVLGVACPNLRKIRPIEEPWRNFEDRDLLQNRMTAATHRHVSQGYLRPRGRRGVLGVVCPNLRKIRPIEEPWRNLEDRDLLLVATR